MTELNAYEANCLENAVAFTAVRGLGHKRTRAEFTTFADAIQHAASFGDGRTMIYAVTDAGMTAHIQNA